MVLANQSWPVLDSRQTYTCETNATLDDPYEGELFTWWLYFYSDLSKEDKELLWEVKRPKLVSVEYNQGGVGPITVQEGNYSSYLDGTKTKIANPIEVIGSRATSSGKP